MTASRAYWFKRDSLTQTESLTLLDKATGIAVTVPYPEGANLHESEEGRAAMLQAGLCLTAALSAQDTTNPLRAALVAIMDCPIVIDPATVPKGKQPCEAPDQVVLTIHVSGRIYANARTALGIPNE